MKSKFKNFPGISIDHVLVVLLIALLAMMIARAHSQDNMKPEGGLRLFDQYAEAAL